MLKSVLKEIILILLILFAIILVLGIFLYDYIPTNKIVPKIEQYQVPNAVKEELKENIEDIEENKTQIVYEIDGTDLKNYEKSKDYQKGKVNPFADDGTTTTNTGANQNTGATANNQNANNSSNNSNNTNTNNTNSNTNNNSNSVGNYLPTTGTK